MTVVAQFGAWPDGEGRKPLALHEPSTENYYSLLFIRAVGSILREVRPCGLALLGVVVVANIFVAF